MIKWRKEPAQGFTLIELLIVVAIIAILAGIAVYNYLDAQTRSKVARVKADLRTMVTGLEAYRADANTYPSFHYVTNSHSNTGYSFHVGGEATGIGMSPPFPGPNPLTSPIAYLTQAPKDLFGGRNVSDPPEAGDFFYTNWDYAMEHFPNPVFGALQKKQGSWRLHSSGPDLYGPDTDAPTGQQIDYDPTNGTVSRGDLVRTQK